MKRKLNWHPMSQSNNIQSPRLSNILIHKKAIYSILLRPFLNDCKHQLSLCYMITTAVSIICFKYEFNWSLSLLLCAVITIFTSVCLLSGSHVERGGSEEEVHSPAGEHFKPDECLHINMDSKTFHLYDRYLTEAKRTTCSSLYLDFSMIHSYCNSAVHTASIRHLLAQEGLCTLWFGASCFRCTV